MLRYAGRREGMLWASQVAPGNENGLTLRVYGTKGGVPWRQDNPNHSVLVTLEPAAADRHARRYRLGPGGGARDPRAARSPGGLSRGLRQHLHRGRGRDPRGADGQEASKDVHFPTVDDGVNGVAFIEAAVKSSKTNGKWVKP